MATHTIGSLAKNKSEFQGLDLQSILERCQSKSTWLAVDEAIYIVGQAACALEAALHSKDKMFKGLVNGELDLSCIHVDFNGEVSVTDFNLTNSPAGNVYSLGVVLWELLCHRRLGKGQVAERPERFNPSIGPALSLVVMKALGQEKTGPFKTLREFFDELHLCLYQVNPRFRPALMRSTLSTLFDDIHPLPEVNSKATAKPSPEAMGNPLELLALFDQKRRKKKRGFLGKLIRFYLIYLTVALAFVIYKFNDPAQLLAYVQYPSKEFVLLKNSLMAKYFGIQYEQATLQHNSPLDTSANIQLVINTEPPNANIEFEGQSWGKTPSHLIVQAGRNVRIKITYPGYQPYDIYQTFTQAESLRIILQPINATR